MRENKQC